MDPIRFKCAAIEYRSGYIEVSSGIHPNCINIETWNAGPGVDVSAVDVRDAAFPEDGVQGNTELELDIATAKKLIEALQLAIDSLGE